MVHLLQLLACVAAAVATVCRKCERVVQLFTHAVSNGSVIVRIMDFLTVFWENFSVFAFLAAVGAAIVISNYFLVERTIGPSRSTQSRSGVASAKEQMSILFVANDALLLFGGDQNGVQFSPPFVDLIAKALSKKTVVTLLVRVNNDAQQHAVFAAIQNSLLPSAGFDMRRLLFCEKAESQVSVARQLLPTIFASAHEASVAEVHRLEAKRGFVRFCIVVSDQGDSTRGLDELTSALGVSTSRQKSE